jgi:WD40 repeat protein
MKYFLRLKINKDGTIKIWYISTGKLKINIDAKSGVYSLKLLPNGLLASGHTYSAIRIWNVNTGQFVKTLGTHSRKVLSLRLINDEILASASSSYTIKIWSLIDNTKLFEFNEHNGVIWILLYYSPLNMLISAAEDYKIKQWNLTSMSLIRTLDGHNNSIFSLAFINNETFVSCSTDGTITFWNIQTGKFLDTIKNNLSNQAIESFGL